MWDFIGPGLLFREVVRQESAVVSSAQRYGLPIMPPELLINAQRTKRSKTLFVLGSGESALQLSERDWSDVRAGISIGVGAWTIHPFIPDFLALEHVNPNPHLGKATEQETLVEKSYREALEGWHAREEINTVSPQILFFRSLTTSRHDRLAPLGDYGRKNTWIYGRVGTVSRTLGELRSEVRRYFRWSVRGVVPHFLPFDTGATVSRLIALGVRAGFERIVLVGVDLRDSRYFWDADPSLLASQGMEEFVTVENSGTHSTESGRRFAMSEVLEVLQDFLTTQNKASLYAGHSSSWLTKILPLHAWS